MLIERPKKCSGVKLLKVEQDFFRNPQRLSSKFPSINERTLNNNTHSIKANFRKSFLNDNKINKNPLRNSNSIINKKLKKFNSFNKLDFLSPKILSLFKNSIKSKKEMEIPISKFDNNVNNQIRALNKKSVSTNNLNNLRNNLSKKSLFFNTNSLTNSNKNKNNVNKICKKKNINNNKKSHNKKNSKIKIKKQIEESCDFGGIEKNTNTNYTNNNVNVIKIVSEDTNIDSRNKEHKKGKFKKIFCCL